jgi:gas vesicle protein
MSQMRKKSFSFEEEDLEWINPILVEWSKENEGKNQSDLVLQLLKEHRDKRPSLKESFDGATDSLKEKLHDYSTKSKDSMDGLAEKSKSGLQSMQDKVQAWRGKIVDRLRKVEADVRTKVEELRADRSQPKEDSEE